MGKRHILSAGIFENFSSHGPPLPCLPRLPGARETNCGHRHSNRIQVPMPSDQCRVCLPMFTLNHRSLVKLCCTNLAPTPSVKILCNLHRQGCFPTTQQEENNPFRKLHTAAGVCGAIPLHPASSMSVMSDRLTKPVPFRTWHWRPQTRFTQSIIYT